MHIHNDTILADVIKCVEKGTFFPSSYISVLWASGDSRLGPLLSKEGLGRHLAWAGYTPMVVLPITHSWWGPVPWWEHTYYPLLMHNNWLWSTECLDSSSRFWNERGWGRECWGCKLWQAMFHPRDSELLHTSRKTHRKISLCSYLREGSFI